MRAGGERFGGGRTGERPALAHGASVTLLAPYLTWARLWLADIDTGGRPTTDFLTRHGAPIRYGYVAREGPLTECQIVFAAHPGSAEMPSAARPFTDRLLTALVTRGIAIAPVTLHTGVSSQEAGELPYAERFAVPAATVQQVAPRARPARASSPWHDRRARARIGRRGRRRQDSATGLRRHAQTGVRAVDGLTGWHEPTPRSCSCSRRSAAGSVEESSGLRCGYS